MAEPGIPGHSFIVCSIWSIHLGFSPFFWSIPKFFLKMEHTLGRSIHFETGAYNFEIFWGELQFY